MMSQLWGPLVDLVGDGGYRAWTIGTWLTLKYANLVEFVVIAALFVAGMFIRIPERREARR